VAPRHENGYTVAAVAILGAGTLAEGARLIEPWPGFTSTASRVISVFLMALWLATAVAVLGRNRAQLMAKQAMAKQAWAFAIFAPLAMFIHAAVTRVGGSSIGLTYMAAAVVLAFLLKRSFVGHSPLINSPGFRGAKERALPD
jgi:hypothetical protein